MKLDSKLIEEYEKNGAVCLRGVFSQDWVDIVRNGIEKNLASPSSFSEKLKGATGDGHYFDDYYNWRRIEEFRKFAFESPAAEIVGKLMKTKEVSFYHEHVLVKEPGADKETPWHHDQSYYPIDGEKVCSIWMPVDPVSRDTCVQFVSGSHKWGWFQPIKFATTLPYSVVDESCNERTYHPVPDIDAKNDELEILSWELQPGDCIVFHMKCLHGAPGNMRTIPRRIFATRWLGDDAVVARRPWKTSPPMKLDIKFGDRASGGEFPIVWKSVVQTE